MQYLSRCLNTIISRLHVSPAFSEIPVRDFMPYQQLLNHQLVHASMISVGRMPYCRYHNDASAEFFGIPDRDVSPLNLGFYYTSMKMRHYTLILHGHQYLLQNQHGEFHCKIDMKDRDGIYQPMHTLFRNVAWNENGKAAYAVVVACPIVDLRYYEAYELLGLQQLSVRALDATRFLFRGFSNEQIADALNLSVKTVEKTLRSVFQTTETASRRHLVEKFEKCREQFTRQSMPMLEVPCDKRSNPPQAESCA